MLAGWKSVEISDLGEVITGNTPPRKQPELYGDHTLFVKPTDINIGERYCLNPEECYSKAGFKKYSKSLIPKGSTCVVTIGSIGKKIIMAHEDLFINQAMNAVVPNGEYDKSFVYYLLKLNLFQLKSFDSGTASGRENVSKSSFSAIKVKVPESKKAQKRIASILSAYDDLIENNLERIKILDEMAKITYKEWFLQMKFPGHRDVEIDSVTGLPVGWESIDMDNACDISGGGTPSRDNEDYWSNGDITWFSPTDLSKAGTYCLLDSSQKITDEGLKKSSAKLLQPNSFMMTSRATIGLFALIDKPFCTNQGFINITPYSEIQKYYLLFNLMSRVPELYNYASGATFPELSKSKFRRLKINWPTTDVFEQFDSVVSPMIQSMMVLTKQNQLLNEAKDILLPRLMTGMIDIDKVELPEVLLERMDN